MLDRLIDHLAALFFNGRENRKPNHALLDVFKITNNEIGEEIKVVINNKIYKHYLIHTKTRSRFTEGEVINYTELIK